VTKRTARFHSAELACSLVLFALSFGVVVWQCSRVGILWDFSYIINTSYRISLGDIPYKDFPIPHPPLTFLVQAGIMRLFGNHYSNTVIYMGMINGITAVLSYLLIATILPRSLAFLCAVPLILLGGYSIFPLPFYDPDCCFLMVLGIFVLHKSQARGFPNISSLLSGMLLVVPVFVKQNLGLSFFVLCHFGLLLMLVLNGFRRDQALGYFKIVLGSACGLIAALTIIHLTGGISNYLQWTYFFAKARRMPSLGSQLHLYVSRTLWVWMFFFLAGSLLLAKIRTAYHRTIGVSFWLVPFVWASLLTIKRSGTYSTGGKLLHLWPVLLFSSTLWLVVDLSRDHKLKSFLTMLPLVILGVAHASFLAEGLWGSTFGIWPLFFLLLALGIQRVTSKMTSHSATILVGCMTFSLVVAGFSYIHSSERLQFAKVNEGKIDRFQSGALRGFSARGPFVSDLKELMDFASQNIPFSVGVIFFPGEDPFYFATGRRPAFPVLNFDDTLNPYAPEELVRLIKSKNITWIVVKTRIQLVTMPMPNLFTVMQLLEPEYVLDKRLRAYDIYRRRGS